MRTSRVIQSGLVAALLVLGSGCGHKASGHKTESLQLDLSVRNDTQIALDWMKVVWDGPDIPGGILSPGISKTAVGVEAPKSDFATLSFVEDVSRKPHSIRLDVSRLKSLRSGQHEAVLAVVSLTEAKLLIDEEQK